MILTPAAAFEALSNVSHILFTLNCGEIYPERLLVCMGVGFCQELKFDFRVPRKPHSPPIFLHLPVLFQQIQCYRILRYSIYCSSFYENLITSALPPGRKRLFGDHNVPLSTTNELFSSSSGPLNSNVSAND
jgi:hypothetical protein